MAGQGPQHPPLNAGVHDAGNSALRIPNLALDSGLTISGV